MSVENNEQKKLDELNAAFIKASAEYDRELESHCNYQGGSDRQERLRDEFLDDAKRKMQIAERELKAQQQRVDELNTKK